jgi:hypothetical protein
MFHTLAGDWSSIGDKEGYWAASSTLQVHLASVRSKLNSFFNIIERRESILRSAYVDGNLRPCGTMTGLWVQVDSWEVVALSRWRSR